MCIVARTDAATIDEGLLRAKRFHEAGADLLLIDGLPSIDALERVGAEVPGRKVINLIHGGKTPLLSSRRLHRLGFKVVLYSTPALYTATRAMLAAMKVLKDAGELGAISEHSVSFREFQQLIEGLYLVRRGNEGLRRSDPGRRADGFTEEESSRARLLRALPPEPGQA
jgi:2-methylisocitrate lyase-like PEP mutase family enzyme